MNNPHDGLVHGISVENIPEKMKQLTHWVVWKLVDRGGKKKAKIPYCVRGGCAKVNDPDTWGNFDDALTVYQRGGYNGIGFVLTGTPFVGVDIDGCIDPDTDEISREAEDAVKLLCSYTELSQSGTGIHIITEGKLPDVGRRTGAFEMYGEGSNRYFVMTGNKYGEYSEIRACQAEIDEVHHKYIQPPDNGPPKPVAEVQVHAGVTLTDQQIIDRAKAASNGPKFTQLWNGDTSGYDEDHSRADLALCSMLAFWCRKDHDRIDGLFRQSGLVRPKWDEKRGRDTYGNIVIEKAIEGCQDVFSGQTEEGWTPPIPFETTITPDFPTECLPAPVADFVTALAENTQTPDEMGALLSLGVLASAFQSRYVVKITPDWTEPLCLYTVAVAPPGERKSAVISALTAPIHEYEATRRDSERAEVEQNRATRSLLEKALQSAQIRAAKNTADFEAGRQAVLKLVEELAEFEDMHPYRLLVDDTTPEKLIDIMDDQNGCITVCSAEGGIFDSMAGRYDRGANFDVYLKSHAGDTIIVDRIGRDPNHINRPRLSIILTIQPEILTGLMNNTTLRGRGLCGRFLYAMCKSKVGRRNVNPDDIPPQIKNDYCRFISRIMAEQETGVIRLSDEAHRLYIEFAELVERKLGNEWEHMRDWSGKLVGAMLRIAALIHSAEQGNPVETPISPETIAAAIKIAECLSVHAEAVYQVMGADDSHEDAKYLLHRLDSTGAKKISRNELWHKCKGKFKKVAAMEPALRILVEMGYIREENIMTGGRPSKIIMVNPLYRKD